MSAIIVLYLLTTAASVLVFVHTVRTVAGEYVERYAVSQNLLQRNRILAIIDRDATLSLKLADDPTLKQWIRSESDPELKRTALEQLESYRRLFRDRTYFVGIAESLSYYIHTPATEGTERTIMQPDAPHDRWFFATLQSDREFWINVDYNMYLNEVRVWVNSLVRAEDGSLLGAAGTGMDLSEFLLTLVDHAEPGITTVILNNEGQILAHRDRALIEHNARVTRDEDRITLETLVDYAEDRTKVGQLLRTLREDSTDYGTVRTGELTVEGRKVTAALGYIRELGWYNLVLVEAGHVIGLSEFYPLLQVILLSLLAVLAAVLALLNRLVLAPLGRLDRAAQELAVGNYDLPLRAERANEIGRVRDSFVEMRRTIRAYTGNLEQMVTERTLELEASQERIMESIRYGRLIQSSIMPAARELERHLHDSFIIHEPLDTVGGDFAYFRPMEGGFCLALIDCTGHGVPGAFMTMMVAAVLSRVMETAGTETGTDEMLLQLHAHVQDGLRAAEDTKHLDNGLDIALCRFHGSANKMEFSGAGLPLVYAADGTVHRIEGSRVRLGFRSTERRPRIQRHSFTVPTGAVFYLFSDGVLDLPGGTHGFGLGYKGLTQILEDVCRKPISAQEESLRQAMHAYQGTHDLRDDLILLGFAPTRAQEAT